MIIKIQFHCQSAQASSVFIITDVWNWSKPCRPRVAPSSPFNGDWCSLNWPICRLVLKTEVKIVFKDLINAWNRLKMSHLIDFMVLSGHTPTIVKFKSNPFLSFLKFINHWKCSIYENVINIDLLFCLFYHRAYLDVKELKEILQLDGSTHLNVFFANSSDEDLAGVATWPWDKEALTHLGRRQKHTRMHAHTYVYVPLMWQPKLCGRSNGPLQMCHFPCIITSGIAVRCTSCVFLCRLQGELCWIPPSTERLVTLTPWSMRSVTVSAFTTCSGAFRRSNHATMRVWRLSPRWKPEICVQTPTLLPNTKAATILIQAMKLVGAGILHTHLSTTTWVMQVSHKQEVHAFPWISRFNLNRLCHLQMTPARTPSPSTRWRGCTVTWTSSTRPGNLCPSPLRYQCRHKWWSSIIIPSAWNGFIPSQDTFTTGEMNQEKPSATGGTLKCCSLHLIHIWPVSKLFALPVCWFPREVGSVCDKCTEGRVLLQYASNSSSPRPCAPSGHWSPREAEGMIADKLAKVTLILDSRHGCFFPPLLVPSKCIQYFHTVVKFRNQNVLKNRSNLFQNFTTCFYQTQ